MFGALIRWWEFLRDRPRLAGPGIDVSHHQGKIDWVEVYRDLDEVAADDLRPWVYVKATEGLGYVDPRCVPNVLAAVGAGLDVGCYHFCRLDSGDDPIADARAEMRAFWSTAHMLPTSLRLCLDIELGGIKRRDRGYCRVWIREAIMWWRARGIVPVIYTGHWTLRWVYGRDKIPARVAACPLWWAEYSNGPAPRRTRPGWAPLLWQHTAKGRVSGIRGKVDRNVVLGTAEDFRRLRKDPKP